MNTGSVNKLLGKGVGIHMVVESSLGCSSMKVVSKQIKSSTIDTALYG